MAGDLVGEAFVRITADTTPMRRAIKRAAKDGAADYTSEFGKQVEQTADARLARARQRLAEALVDPTQFGEMRKRFESVGDAANNFRGQLEQLRRQGDLSKREMKPFIKAINDWEIAAQKAEDAAAALTRQEAEQNAERKREVEINRAIDAGLKVIQKRRADSAKEEMRQATERDKMLREHEALLKSDVRLEEAAAIARRKALESEVDDYERLITEKTKVDEDRVKARDRMLREHEAQLKREQDIEVREGVRRRNLLRDEIDDFEKYGSTIDFTRTRLGKMSKGFSVLDDRIASAGNRLSRVFGKGSRNNFLNLFGAGVGALTTGPLRVLAKAGEGITGTFGKMVESFNKAREAGSSVFGALASSGATLGASLLSSIPGLIAAAAGIAAIASIAPIATSALFLLAGALTAIAGSLTLGILAPLLAVSPLLLTVIASIGAGFALYQRMNKEGTKAAKSLESIKKTLSNVVKSQGENLDLLAEKVARSVSSLTRAFQPLLDGAIDGIGRFIDSFTSQLESPKVAKALGRLGKELPDQLGLLGSALGGLSAGLIGFFDAISPYTKRLLEAFDGLMDRFNTWANSAEGKNDVADFMRKAWEAADDLWNILGNVVSILGELFGQGQDGPGGDFLQYIRDLTADFKTFLESPEGQTAVQDFFSDVGTFMRDTKDLIGELAGALGDLDTESAREDLSNLMQSITDITNALRFFTQSAEVFTFGLKLTLDGFTALSDKAQEIYEDLFGEGGSLSGIKGGIGQLGIDLGLAIPAAFGGLVALITQPFTDGASNASKTMTALPGKIGTALSRVPGTVVRSLASVLPSFLGSFNPIPGLVGGILSRVLRNVSTQTGGIPGAIRRAIGGIAAIFSTPFQQAYAVVSGWVRAIAGLVSSAIRNASQAASTIRATFSAIPGLPKFASGGILTAPTTLVAGEAGAEAIVPLNRPLSQVDPSVRALSAIAQGKTNAYSGGSASSGGKSVTFEAGAIVIQTTGGNASVIAESVLDRLASQFR